MHIDKNVANKNVFEAIFIYCRTSFMQQWRIHGEGCTSPRVKAIQDIAILLLNLCAPAAVLENYLLLMCHWENIYIRE